MKVIVVGAGIAGLGSATYFAGKGHDVTVLEATDRIGGRARTVGGRNNVDIVDAGTQYFHSSYRFAIQLIIDAGLEKTLSRIRGYTKVIEGETPSSHFLLHHKFPWYKNAGFSGNILLGIYLLRSLFDIPFDSFGLASDSASDRRNAYTENTDKLVLNSIIRPLSLAGTLTEPDLRNISQYHINRLIRIILFTDYLSLSGGISSLHTALAARLDVCLEQPVKRLLYSGNRVEGVEIGDTGKTIRADHVVVCTPPPIASALIPDEWITERLFLDNIRIPSFVLPTFFLDRPIDRNIWSYLIHNKPGFKIKYVTDAYAKNSEMIKSAKSAIQPWICYPDSVDISSLTDDMIIALCIKELDLVFPGFPGWIEDILVTRHPFGVPFHPPGHNLSAREFLHGTDKRGVSFCGDYLTGGYVESALWSAWRAANRFG